MVYAEAMCQTARIGFMNSAARTNVALGIKRGVLGDLVPATARDAPDD
jgi:hypothetical protein